MLMLKLKWNSIWIQRKVGHVPLDHLLQEQAWLDYSFQVSDLVKEKESRKDTVLLNIYFSSFNRNSPIELGDFWNILPP